MDDLDRILGSEERLEPSSGLTDSIMEAVREEAHTPAPIAFPWLRLVPGFVVAVGLLAVGIVMAVAAGVPDTQSASPEQIREWVLAYWNSPWTLLAMSLAASWLAWRLPTKLAARLG